MSEIQIRSYAKINLTLEVGEMRPDGFHDIDSVVQVIDLSDELTIGPAEPGAIDVSVVEGSAPQGRENLVYRACEAFVRATGVRGGARIALRKRIPLQAGLGGGSSNAAAAIAGLNSLHGCGLSVEEMATVAARVGSDAALFLYGGTVRVRGRGDLATVLPDAPELSLAIVRPGVGVSTAWAYAELDRRSEHGARGAGDRAEEAVSKGDRSALLESLHNDFDRVIPALVDEVGRAREALEQENAEQVLLAGSGSAVFGVYPSMDRAAEAADRLSGRFAGAYAARSLARAESALGSSPR